MGHSRSGALLSQMVTTWATKLCGTAVWGQITSYPGISLCSLCCWSWVWSRWRSVLRKWWTACWELSVETAVAAVGGVTELSKNSPQWRAWWQLLFILFSMVKGYNIFTALRFFERAYWSHLLFNKTCEMTKLYIQDFLHLALISLMVYFIIFNVHLLMLYAVVSLSAILFAVLFVWLPSAVQLWCYMHDWWGLKGHRDRPTCQYVTVQSMINTPLMVKCSSRSQQKNKNK